MNNNFFDFSVVDKRELRLEEHLAYVEQLLAARSASTYYPHYHLAPPHGLLNDPNGLMHLQGEYHIFHQWFPLGPVHGLKYWRYLTTRDFITYTDRHIALGPYDEQDCMGCYSGMAFLGAGKPQIFYTGLDAHSQQNVVQAEFHDYQISHKRIVVKRDAQRTTENFRDPFVFKKQDETYMLVGGESPARQGIICVYAQEAEQFTYRGNLSLRCADTGYMLECPNYVQLQEQDVLIVSPQGLTSSDPLKFRNVFSVAYLVGKLDLDNLSMQSADFQELDHGFDFYAPQVFEDEQGRTILIGWLGNSKAVYPSDHEQWAHMLTLPRHLTLVDNLLCQQPLPELLELRASSQTLSGSHQLQSTAFELTGQALEGLSITLSNAQGANLTFRVQDDFYTLDRSGNSQLYNEQYGLVRQARVLRPHSSLRIFVDASAIEIFADDGLTVFTARFFITDLSYIQVEGATLDIHYLKSIVVQQASN